MKFRTTFILFVLVIAATLFWAFYTGSQLSDKDYAREQKRVFPGAEYQAPEDPYFRSLAERVVRIELRHKASVMVMQRESAATTAPWRIMRPVATAADAEEVASLLDTVEKLEAVRTVTRGDKPALDLATYGLDTPARTIIISTPEQQILTLHLGAETIDKQALYAARPDMPDTIFVIPTLLLIRAGRTLDEFRDKTLLRFNPAAVNAIELTAGSHSLFACRFVEPAWRLTGAVEDEVDLNQLRGIVSVLRKARISPADFVTDDTARAAEFGLDPAMLALTLVEGEMRKTLLLGAVVKDRVNRIYARRSDEATVFTLANLAVAPLIIDAENLRATTALPFQLKSVTGIEIVTPGETVQLALEENKWRFLRPADARAEDEQVKEFLLRLQALDVRKRLDNPTEEMLAAAGLTAPAVSLKLARANIGPRLIHFGKASGVEGLTYARRDWGGPILLVGSGLLKQIHSGHLAFIKQAVLEFEPDDVVGLSIKRPDVMFQLDCTEGNWSLRKPAKVPAHAGAVKDLLWTLSGLEARDIVAENPAGLVSYGLDNPRIRAEITVAAKKSAPQTHTLLIGKQTPNGNAFAMVSGSPLVFHVSAKTLDRLSAQFASDQICSFNPARAHLIEIIQPAGGVRLRLKRVGARWRMAAPHEAPADALMVEQILDELDSLRGDGIAAWDKTRADREALGLGAGGGTVRVTLDENVIREIRVGKPHDGICSVVASDSPLVYTIQSAKLEVTLKWIGD